MHRTSTERAAEDASCYEGGYNEDYWRIDWAEDSSKSKYTFSFYKDLKSKMI